VVDLDPTCVQRAAAARPEYPSSWSRRRSNAQIASERELAAVAASFEVGVVGRRGMRS